MKNKLFHFVLLVMATSLLSLNVAFASPPPDGDGTNGNGTTGDGTNDTGNNGGPINPYTGETLDPSDPRANWTQEDWDLWQQGEEEHEQTYGNDHTDRGVFSTSEQAVANDITDCPEAGNEDAELPESFTQRNAMEGYGAGYYVYTFNPNDCSYDREYVRDRSCFDASAMITMADGTEKSVKNIREGDMVWNPVLKKAQRVKHRLAGPEKLPMIEVGYNGMTVKITQTHPMIIRGSHADVSTVALKEGKDVKSTIVRADQLQEDHFILGADGEFHKIETLRELPVNPEQIVYNFELEADSKEAAHHMIVANGILTGDVRVQADLNQYELPWEKKVQIRLDK